MARPGKILQLTLLSGLLMSFLAGEIFGGTGGLPTVAMTEGILCMAINAVLVLPLRRKYAFKDENVTLAPMLCAILTLTAPGVLHCTSLLSASILVTVSIFFSTGFAERPEKMELFVLSFLTLEAAAIFWMPVLWMSVPYLISGLVRAENKMKLAASAVIGILAPVAIFLAISYLNDNLAGSLSLLKSAINSNLLSLPAERHIRFSMPSILKYFVVAAAVAISVFRFIFREKPNVRTLLAARIQMIILLPSLLAICVAFYGEAGAPSTMLMCPLAAMFTNDYLEGCRNRKQANLYLVLFIVTLISERFDILNIIPF